MNWRTGGGGDKVALYPGLDWMWMLFRGEKKMIEVGNKFGDFSISFP